MTMKFGGVRNFLARTAPETPMQRVGALVMSFSNLLGFIVILITIAAALAGRWSAAGVASSVFGIALTLCFIALGLVHGFAALRPQALNTWKQVPDNRVEEIRMRMFEQMKELYSVVGWCAVLVVFALMIYLFIVRSA